MTIEQRASLIKWSFWTLVIAGIIIGVFVYRKSTEEPPPDIRPIAENGLELILHRVPGEKDSDELSAILEKVERKYGKLLIVRRVDFKRHPEVSKAQGVVKTPHVIINTKTGRAFEFQGLWTQPQIEMKVDEILRGLKRMTKDWRPPVPGMKPISH